MLRQFIYVFMGFFAIMNPIANTPIFLSLTADDSNEIRKRVAGKAVLAAFILILVFSLLGKLIFQVFGITLPAFRIMGGVLVALIGYQMMHGNPSPVHRSHGVKATDTETALSVALTPLAIPILAGPGTIATAMNYASVGGFMNMLVTLGAFCALCVVTYLAFIYGERLVRHLGSSGLSVITRIMGLILGVIGVQMLIDGVDGAIRAFR